MRVENNSGNIKFQAIIAKTPTRVIKKMYLLDKEKLAQIADNIPILQSLTNDTMLFSLKLKPADKNIQKYSHNNADYWFYLVGTRNVGNGKKVSQGMFLIDETNNIEWFQHLIAKINKKLILKYKFKNITPAYIMKQTPKSNKGVTEHQRIKSIIQELDKKGYQETILHKEIIPFVKNNLFHVFFETAVYLTIERSVPTVDFKTFVIKKFALDVSEAIILHFSNYTYKLISKLMGVKDSMPKSIQDYGVLTGRTHFSNPLAHLADFIRFVEKKK